MEMRLWNGGWNCIIRSVFTICFLCSSERAGNALKNLLEMKVKNFFWDMSIDRILFNL